MTGTPVRGGGAETVGSTLAAADELEIRIEKLVDGGDGFGRYRGAPIFVPRSAPGDLLRVRIVERRRQYGRAEIVEILEPGAGRRAAPCPFFERCGGCDLQHLEDGLQTELKVDAARETLTRLGGLELPDSQRVIVGDAWGYRLRTQLQVRPGEERAAIGYHRRGTREVVEVDRCPVLVKDLESLLPLLPKRLGGETVSRLDLLASSEALSAAPPVAGLPGSDIALAVGDWVYRLDARVFFQGHAGLLEELISAVVGEDRGGEAVDLYSGAGFFTLPLARRYDTVVAVEGDRVATRYGRKNARLNGITNIDFVPTAVDGWIPQLRENTDRVVVDPPRVGLTAKVRVKLLERRPKRLTYVSCHAAALARDLKMMGPGFVLEELTFLDLFPQTGHLEIVAQLRRRPPKKPI